MARRSFQRTDRLGKQIGEVIAVALQRETREELLHQMIVTGCDVTRDLSFATIHYYLPDGADRGAVVEALERASGFLRGRVGQQVRARNTPQLKFLYDSSVDHARRIESILTDIGPLPEPQEGPDDVPEIDGEADSVHADDDRSQ